MSACVWTSIDFAFLSSTYDLCEYVFNAVQRFDADDNTNAVFEEDMKLFAEQLAMSR